MVALPSLAHANAFASTVNGAVSLVEYGPAWYSGTSRLVQAMVTREGINEVATVALGGAARGEIGAAVVLGLVALEPAFDSGVDAIRAWMATAGVSASGGQLYQGATQAFQNTAMQNNLVQNIASINGLPYTLHATLTGYQVCSDYPSTWFNNTYNIGTAGNWGTGSTMLAWYGCYNHTAGVYVGYDIAPASGSTTITQGNSSQQLTPAGLAGLLVADQAGSGTVQTQAQAAEDEADNIITAGLAGTGAVADGAGGAPAASAVAAAAIPATASGATSAGQEAANQVVSVLPSSGAITSSNPSAGTVQGTSTQQEAYNDPSYDGSLSTSAWPTPGIFAADWQNFETSVMNTGVFALWGNSFGGTPTGGGSSYTFDAGVFGTHTYDFSTWGSTVFGCLSGLVQIACGLVGVKIATISGTGG